MKSDFKKRLMLRRGVQNVNVPIFKSVPLENINPVDSLTLWDIKK